MTTAHLLEQPAVRNRIVPLSVVQYRRLGEWGFLAHDTELLNGIIVKKMPKSPLHEYFVSVLYHLFIGLLSKSYWVRKEAPLTLSDSEPEPDISIVRGQARNFKTAHPVCAELVIEVAVSSVELDRTKKLFVNAMSEGGARRGGEKNRSLYEINEDFSRFPQRRPVERNHLQAASKAFIYAAATIAEYWILLPEQCIVEVYRQPQASGYAKLTRYTQQESIITPENTRIDLQNLFA